ncbi:retinol-binding protein pinta-like [Chrysoperla carnea]|uniref:retinol-binding protein pinta-like n=1 Tax=Chrysoperla carnea TaxID=189513 RepID=UPI001D077906|nr:retinol-binding protein pinta-like [Chrysoperla carnea]
MDQALHSNRSSVLKYYNKSEKDVQSDVNIILESLEKKAHFPKIKDENALRNKIEAFLIFNKFHIEKTKQKLDLCYSYRNIYPEFFDNWDPCSAEFEKTFSIFRYTPLPYLTKELNRVSFIELTDKVHDNFEPLTHFKTFLMSFETRISHDCNAGEIIIYDCSKANLNIVKQLTPSILKKAVDINLKGYSVRLAGLHLLHPPNGLPILLTILKALVKPKIYERIHLHNDLESLHKAISKEYLPKNLGGELTDSQILTDTWYGILKNNRVNLIEESKLRTDESKRIEKLNEDEFFGSMHGSFKKLEFD